MAQEWIDHKQGLVGQVDCTEEHEFCQEMNVEGLPTLLYGEPSGQGVFLQEYRDDKDYQAISQFANDTLPTTVCSPLSIHHCEAEVQERITEFMAMPLPQVEAWIQQKEDEIAAANKFFKTQYKQMQKEYDEQSTNHNFLSAQIKQNIKMLQAVKAAKAK